ncbi:MAG TPA: GAF domain-containing protein, partial [Nitriliruptorales bacterium]
MSKHESRRSTPSGSDLPPVDAPAATPPQTLLADAVPWVGTLRALQQAAAVITQTTDLDQLFEAVADQVQLVVPYHSLRLFLLEDDGEHLAPVAIRTTVDDAEIADLDDPRFRLRLGQGVTGHIAQTGRPEIVYDLEAHPLAFHMPDTPRVEESMIGVPLVHGGQTIGVLTLTKHGLSQFTPEQSAMIEVLAVTVTSSIEHRRSLEAQHRALQAQQQAATEQARLRELHSTFVANVSHELRTPLTTIQGFLELALRQAPDALKPLLVAASRGSRRLGGLVEDLLEIVSLEAGRQRIAPQPHRLGALLQVAYRKAGEVADRV